jgi:hypothetical protein
MALISCLQFLSCSCIFLQLFATMQVSIGHSCVVAYFIGVSKMSIMLNFVVHCIFSTCFAFTYKVMFFAIGIYNSTTFFTRQTSMLLWQFADISCFELAILWHFYNVHMLSVHSNLNNLLLQRSLFNLSFPISYELLKWLLKCVFVFAKIQIQKLKWCNGTLLTLLWLSILYNWISWCQKRPLKQ